MESFSDWAIDELCNRGMFPSQAEKVMQMVAVSDKDIACRLNDRIQDYPPMMRTAVWMVIETKALEFIKENCPEAWFRPVFDKEHPTRKKFEKEKGKVPV